MPAETAVPAAKQKNLAGIHQIYNMVSRFLQLSGQVESIDYTAENFVHADLTIDEFSEMQANAASRCSDSP